MISDLKCKLEQAKKDRDSIDKNIEDIEADIQEESDKNLPVAVICNCRASKRLILNLDKINLESLVRFKKGDSRSAYLELEFGSCVNVENTPCNLHNLFYAYTNARDLREV